MTKKRERIAALERENKSLRAELARLQAPIEPLAIEPLIAIGRQLANAAFSISQRHVDDRKTLERLVREWDDAMRAAPRAALNAASLYAELGGDNAAS